MRGTTGNHGGSTVAGLLEIIIGLFKGIPVNQPLFHGMGWDGVFLQIFFDASLGMLMKHDEATVSHWIYDWKIPGLLGKLSFLKHGTG